jgi:hypothetical protein
MRAYEFITEASTKKNSKKKGAVPRNHEHAAQGIIRFKDDGTDRLYNLNQVMKATAMADGKSTKALDMDYESFAGKNNLAYPYTEVEHNMMKQALNTVGDSNHKDLVKDHRSLEVPDTQRASPVKQFKGYGK